ncbi:unnamed protein product, partial [Mesorhabditis spiculigera]
MEAPDCGLGKATLGEDGNGTVELLTMQRSCDRQHKLLNVMEECIRQLHQNDAQLDILAETANFLKKRHDEIKKNITKMSDNERAMELLRSEMEKVQRQVGIWLSEVKEVRQARNDIEIRIEVAHGEAKRCHRCGRLADARLEEMQRRHEKLWKHFIDEWTLALA